VVRKRSVERPLGRSRLRWRGNIKVGFKELSCDGVDWFNVAHDMAKWQSLAGKFRDSIKNFQVPKDFPAWNEWVGRARPVSSVAVVQ
jgi:hypothetical protein